MVTHWLQLMTDIQCGRFGGKCIWRKLCRVFHGCHLLRVSGLFPAADALLQPTDVHKKVQRKVLGVRVTATHCSENIKWVINKLLRFSVARIITRCLVFPLLLGFMFP